MSLQFSFDGQYRQWISHHYKLFRYYFICPQIYAELKAQENTLNSKARMQWGCEGCEPTPLAGHFRILQFFLETVYTS